MTKIENEKRFIIEKEKVLLVEDKDEVVFLTVFLKEKNIQNIQIIDTGGKDQFKKDFLTTLKNTHGFNKVTSLAIIQDADTDAQARFKSICSTLRSDLPVPTQMASFTKENPKVGIFIMPDCQNEGMLEFLCLSTIESEDKALQCVDDFMKCLEQNNLTPKNTHKARCRAFLSAMKDDTPSLGVAAQKVYWNFNSEKLKPLSNFLKNL